MENSRRRGAGLLFPVLFLLLAGGLAALAWRQPVATAGSPPPDVPDFEGEPFSATLELPADIPQEIVEFTVPHSGWQLVFEEDFEGVNWDANWYLNISKNGQPYKWGTRDYPNPLDPGSDMVAWAVGGGNGGSQLNPNQDGYPNNVDSWLIAGPFNFADVIDARLTFDYYFGADTGDKFAIGTSTDGSTFVGTENNGGVGSWASVGQDLTAYAGEPQVWLAFAFTSDNQPNNADRLGALLDNVQLNVEYTSKTHLPYVVYGFTPTPPPTPTPTVTPTATPPSGGDYRKGFGDNIDGWEFRRSTLGAAYNLFHDGGCDGDRCGFLNLKVNDDDNYVLVAPMVPARPRPYNIETEAKFRSPRRDQDSYSIVFGGNWNGGACPAPDFSTCFTNYYELRVRYRDDGNKTWIEYKLKRVDGHDSDNQSIGPDLIDWTKVDADEDDFVEWDVNVSSGGTIRIAADDKSVGQDRDTRYIDNPYFGLMVRARPSGDTEVRFDYIQVDEP